MNVRHRWAVAVTSVTALVAVTVPLAGTASADSPGVPVTGDAASTSQVDGRVWSMDSAGGVVYAGGEFGNVTDSGTGSTLSRSNFAAFNGATGALLSDTRFAPHTFNGAIRAVEVSPDGGTVYVGGDFSSVDGQSRSRVAAFDTSDGSLLAWQASVGNVRSLAVSDTTVYVGGWFSSAQGQSRRNAAAFDRSQNWQNLTDWNPSTNAAPFAIEIVKSTGDVVLGGGFSSVDGQTERSLALVDPSTGDLDSGWTIPDLLGWNTAIRALEVDQRAGVETIYAGSGEPAAVSSTERWPSTRSPANSSGATPASAQRWPSCPSRERCSPAPTRTHVMVSQADGLSSSLSSSSI